MYFLDKSGLNLIMNLMWLIDLILVAHLTLVAVKLGQHGHLVGKKLYHSSVLKCMSFLCEFACLIPSMCGFSYGCFGFLPQLKNMKPA